MLFVRRCGELVVFGFGEDFGVRLFLSGCIRVFFWIVVHCFFFVVFLV